MSRALAIVTGGSTGIGRCLVHALARSGYAVAFSYKTSSAEAEKTIFELRQSGMQVMGALSDVGVRSEVEAFVNAAVIWHGAEPSLLVNNAGIQTWCPLLDLPEERWDEVMRTNLKGCFLNTQIVAKRMAAAAKGGSIINIGSGCNKVAFPNLVDYTASKGGIEQFTKSSAVELGAFGITVNCVAPGAIATERTHEESPDYESLWAPITPLRRVGSPQDVADVVLFFASSAARFVTGQTLWVDGGLFTRAAWPYRHSASDTAQVAGGSAASTS